MKNLIHEIPCIIAGIMLLVAIVPMPADYYSVLKWVVCIAALLMETVIFVWYHKWYDWRIIIFALIAIMFNPINQADMSKLVYPPTRVIWIFWDIVSSILFFYMVLVKDKSRYKDYDILSIFCGLIVVTFITGIAFGTLLFLRDLLIIFN